MLNNIKDFMTDPNKFPKSKLALVLLLIAASWASSRIWGPGNLVGTIIFILFMIIFVLHIMHLIQQKRSGNDKRRT
ncbi:hypothetical protein [Salisediminibacterium beveridgei]|uniref:Uncharacterized protein n=1 Tax=Salisediminibacterium beveridgei TaxID=632773 RepID=A0A1D7QX52_9BACI|nr:hypothetical protein [Salisediminibacterium beveridgei]AOM83548.1 hypothetical protein BBEV_2190 [Salisediminibacterium beveridgei]